MVVVVVVVIVVICSCFVLLVVVVVLQRVRTKLLFEFIGAIRYILLNFEIN